MSATRGLEDLILYAYIGTYSPFGDYMVLDDAVRGELDATYTLASSDEEPVDLTSYVSEISVSRGRRSRLTDVINPGQMTVVLRNESRYFDPLYTVSPFYPGIEPGRRVDLKWTDSHHIFSGIVESWDYWYDPTGRVSTATMVVVDALGQVAHAELAAHTATSQAAGARVSAVLDRAEVSFGANRYIDAGESTLQADTVAEGTNVLGYLQNVARSDQGYLFANRWNLLTFLSRTTIAEYAANSLLTLSDQYFAQAYGDMPYHGLTATVNMDQVFGRVTVQRTGGTAQTVSNSSSTTSYGWRSLTYDGLLLNDDAECLSLATYLANRYAAPVWRIQSLTLNVNAFEALSYEQYICAVLDISNAITVHYTITGAFGGIEQTYIIEGIDRTISARGDHLVTLWLGDFDSLSLFILDDEAMGVLDTSALAF